MVADFQTSMKEIREANLAFISLLTQLKRFVTGKGTVTVRTYRWDADAKADVVDAEWEVPTIPSLIEAYRGGNFDEVVLKSGDSEIHLKNDGNVLQVTDKDGNLASLEVSQLKYAALVGCTIDSATIRECMVDTLEALGSISVNTVNCQSLSVTNSFVAVSAMLQGLVAAQISASAATIRKLAVHSMVFSPATVRNVFATTSPYNYSDHDAVFDTVAVGTHAYVCKPTQAEVSMGWREPSTMGFVELPPSAGHILTAPDMMAFQGNTAMGNYLQPRSLNIANCYAIGTGPLGTAVHYSTASAVKASGSAVYCDFGYLLGWPIRSFVREPALDPMLPPVMRDNARGIICLHEFSAADIGRVIFIRTFGNSWKIPRRLTTEYENGVLKGSMLDLDYLIPPYTSLRLRLARHAAVDGAKAIYYNVMELT